MSNMDNPVVDWYERCSKVLDSWYAQLEHFRHLFSGSEGYEAEDSVKLAVINTMTPAIRGRLTDLSNSAQTLLQTYLNSESMTQELEKLRSDSILQISRIEVLEKSNENLQNQQRILINQHEVQQQSLQSELASKISKLKSSQARALSEQKAALNVEATSEVNRLTREHSAVLEEQKRAHAAEVDEMSKSFEECVVAQDQHLEQLLDQLRTAQKDRTAEVEDLRGQIKSKDLRLRAHSLKLKDNVQRLQDQRAYFVEFYTKELESQRKAIEDAAKSEQLIMIENTKKVQQEEPNRVFSEASKHNDGQREAELATKLEHERSNHQREIEVVRAEARQVNRTMRTAFAERLKKAEHQRDEYRSQVHDLEARLAIFDQAVESRVIDAIDEVVDEHREIMEANHRHRIDVLEAKHQQQLAAQREQHDRAIGELKARHARALVSLPLVHPTPRDEPSSLRPDTEQSSRTAKGAPVTESVRQRTIRRLTKNISEKNLAQAMALAREISGQTVDGSEQANTQSGKRSRLDNRGEDSSSDLSVAAPKRFHSMASLFRTKSPVETAIVESIYDVDDLLTGSHDAETENMENVQPIIPDEVEINLVDMDVMQVNAITLYNMFLVDWEITQEQQEGIIARFESLFVRNRAFNSVKQAIDKYVVGRFPSEPPFPRACMFAALKGEPRGPGGSNMTQQDCVYCLERGQLCVWATYFPGAASGYPPRRGGRVRNPVWNPTASPETVPLETRRFRWVLKLRKQNVEDPDDPQPVLGRLDLQ